MASYKKVIIIDNKSKLNYFFSLQSQVSIVLLSLTFFIDISESNPIFGNVLSAYRDNCKGFVCKTETPVKLFKAFVGLNYKEKTMIPKKPLELKHKDPLLKHSRPQTVASNAEESRFVITTPSTIGLTIFSTVKTDSHLTTPSKSTNFTNHSSLSVITSPITTTSTSAAHAVAKETTSSSAKETTSLATTVPSIAKETSSATTVPSIVKETSSAITASSIAEMTFSATTTSTPSTIITNTSQSEYSTVSLETDFSTQDIGDYFESIRE